MTEHSAIDLYAYVTNTTEIVLDFTKSQMFTHQKNFKTQIMLEHWNIIYHTKLKSQCDIKTMFWNITILGPSNEFCN